jgi:hypothetical protein
VNVLYYQVRRVVSKFLNLLIRDERREEARRAYQLSYLGE